MRFGGWLRLWIVVSVLYLIAVVVFTVITLPQPDNIPHSASFYAQMPPDLRSKLLDAKSAGTDDHDKPTVIVKMPNRHTLQFGEKIPPHEQQTVATAYWNIVKETASEARWKYIGLAFLGWVIPVLAVYAIGWSVAWVYQGFRHQ
jgi:hypothetical protein